MVEYFCQAHKTKPHAQPKKTPRAGYVGNPTHLLCLSEPFGVGLFYKNIDYSHVALCIVINLTLDG